MVLSEEAVNLILVAVLIGIYAFGEPRLKKHRMLIVFTSGALSIVFADIMVAPVAAHWPLTLEAFLMAETKGSAHIPTYLMIGAVYFIALAATRWQAPMEAALTAALFVAMHEGLYFTIFYAAHPEYLMVQPRVIGDIATGLLYIAICTIYWFKRYSRSEILYYGTLTYLGIEVIRYGLMGPYMKPETLITAMIGELSWAYMFCIILWHVWSVRGKACV